VYMLGYGAAPFCVIPRMWKTEVWINPDGLEWARSKWSLLAKTYFRIMEWVSTFSANRIIADAQAIAESLEKRHGKLPQCTMIPYGCEVIDVPSDPASISQWGLNLQSYFLVVCRLEPENHVLEILQAFQQSQSKRQLVIVGNHLADTSYIARLRSVKDSRIQMIGTVYEQTKLTSLRTNAFGYLHGHSVGGTNPSLLEAMGCGNLIFAHDNPFNRETLGSCGLYFRAARDLALAIDQAELSNGQPEEFRDCARSRARERYRWPNIIARYASLLEQVAERSTNR
jgi:glycosyltransferase involved in cell wall biosynthesis